MHKELSFENRLAYEYLLLIRYTIIVVFIVIVTVIDSFIVVFCLLLHFIHLFSICCQYVSINSVFSSVPCILYESLARLFKFFKNIQSIGISLFGQDFS